MSATRRPPEIWAPMDIKSASDAELQTELNCRRSAAANKVPVPLAVPDFSSLKDLIVRETAKSIEYQHEDEDFEHWVYEAALLAVYGPDYWLWRNAQSWD